MPSIRESVMANLLTAIQAINGSPTYVNTITSQQVVSREPWTIVEITRANQFPAILLSEDTMTPDYHFEQTAAFVPSDMTLYAFDVAILVAVEARSQANTALNSWLADVLKAVMVDITRGGVAYDTVMTSIAAPQENRVVPDGLAAAEMRFRVKYMSAANTL